MYSVPGTITYAAMSAGNSCTSYAQRMQGQPGRMSAQTMCSMWTTASAAASIHLIQAGVLASVSLFVLLVVTGSLLIGLIGLVSLLGLIGLLSLSGLTGLIISLVGLYRGLSPGTKTGD